MRMLLGLGGLAVLAASLAAAAAGVRAAWAWRHDRARFLLCILGIAGTLAVAGPRIAMLAGALPPAAGWPAWLRLVPEAALAALFVVLLQTLARGESEARRAAAAAAANTVTSLPNRAVFLAQTIPALARCRREAKPATMLALTLVDLPALEARHGPAAAREALRDLAGVLRETARGGDLPGHLASDVLAALLPATDAQGAARLAGRLRAAVAARLPDPAMDGRRLDVAIGIAEVGDGAGPAVLDEAMDAAADALAQALAGSGERLVLAPSRAPRSASAPA